MLFYVAGIGQSSGLWHVLLKRGITSVIWRRCVAYIAHGMKRCGKPLEQTLTEPHVIAASDGGLHLTVQLEGIDDRRVTEQARHYQLAPAPLSQYYLNPAESRSGVVLGYGNTSASQFAPALRILNRIIVQAGRGSA